MNNIWKDKWDERYSQEGFAYGVQPNLFFKSELEKLHLGKILLPAEGEGRNAVFAATQGWQVSAFDISPEGKKKALQLAKTQNASIDYQVGELASLNYQPEEFDAIALIYAHFPAAIKSAYHKELDKYLRKGGIIIFEAFSKKHLEYIALDKNMGGPKDLDSLFSIEEIQGDFSNYHFLTLEETEVTLSEGQYHNGKGAVIRFVAVKQ